MKVRDRFLYFTFNGVHSSEFDLFYINSGEDITLPFTPVVKFNTSNPLYQNRSYIVGTNSETRQLKLRVAADKKEIKDIEDILIWLDQTGPGEISFDFRPDYKHKVFISSISEPTLIPWETKDNRLKSVTYFDVTFDTYDDHSALTRESYLLPNIVDNETKVLYEPDSLLPIYFKKNSLEHDFVNWSKANQTMNITSVGTGLKIKNKRKGKEVVQYHYSGLPSGTIVQIDTGMGALQNMGNLLENNFKGKGIKNLGPMPIKPGLVISGYIDLDVVGTNCEIKTDFRFKNLDGATNVYIQIEDEKSKEATLEYNRDDNFWFKGHYEHDLNNRIVIPKYSEGVVTSKDGIRLISFSNTGLGLKPGKTKVSIAVPTRVSIEPVGGIVNVEFNYKKER